MRSLAILVATLAASLCAADAAAQPPPGVDGHTRLTLEQLISTEIPIVHGASRFAQQVVDAPSSITIVTRDEIARFGYRTLADLLRGVRGFYVTYDRNYAYVGTRGLARPGDYNTRILVLVNGHQLNDNIYDLTLLETAFVIDMELIDRVEIVRGPSSSLYGTSAFFGVVNIVTHTGASGSGVRGDVEVGSLGTRSARASVGHLFTNGAQALFSVSAYHSDGQGGAATPLAAPGMDDDDATRTFGTASYGPWTAQAAVSSRRKRIPTGAFGTTLDDRRNHTADVRAFAGVTFEKDVRDTRVTARASHDWYHYDGSYVYEASPLFRDNARGEWGSVEVLAVRRWRAHRVTGGLEVQRNGRQDQQGWYVSEPVEISLHDERQSTNRAVFVQDEWRLASWALVNAGVRHDRYSLVGHATSPRAGLILKPTSTSAVKVLHGQAFRAPNLYESFYYAATRPLRPERITTNEVVAELYEAGGLRLAVSGFVYRIGNLIAQSMTDEPDSETLFVNLESVRAAGVELEAQRAWRGGWQVGGSYTRQQVLEGASGELVSNSPRHSAVARASGPALRDRVTTGVEMLYTSSRTSVYDSAIPAYVLANISVSSTRPLAGGLFWSLHLRNVLDTRYYDPGTLDHPVDRLQQDGRTVALRASWRF